MDNVTREKYYDALESFLEKAKKDAYVSAILLAGSLSYDVVWRKSDIDLIIIVEDQKKPYKFHSLVENDVIINAAIYTRNQFKRQFETELSSSQFHSFISKSKLLFTKDDEMKEYFENMSYVGDSDKEMLLLINGAIAVAHLAKAQKWLLVKKDFLYSYIEIVKLIEILAKIEVILNDNIPSREVIHQALEYNGEFFKKIYVELAQREKDMVNIQENLLLIEKYLEDHTQMLFRLIFKLLSDTNEPTGITELHQRLSLKTQIDKALLVEAFEWLVEKQLIEKFSSPVRITTKSRTQVDEVAYCYDGESEI